MNKKHIIDENDVKDNIRHLRILNEAVDQSKIVRAMMENDVVYIYYAGDNTVNKGYRTIEPYVIGKSKAGNLVVRAWQQAGATDTGIAPLRSNDEIPGWRMFRVDGISSMVKTLKKFDTSEEFIRTQRPNYNPQDRDMTKIFYAIEPGKAEPDQDKTGDDSIDQPDVQTTTTPDTGAGFFRSQADKFKSFFQKPKAVSKAWIDQQKAKFLQMMRNRKPEDQVDQNQNINQPNNDPNATGTEDQNNITK
jgi:hypothetical protein